MTPRIADIQRAISERQHIGVSAIKGRRGSPKIVRARHAAMYLSRRLTRHSYHVIGQHFGGRDHSTVIHGYRLVQERIFRNQKTRKFVAAIIDELTQQPKSTFSGDKWPFDAFGQDTASA